MQHAIARADKGQQSCGDCRHARGEQRAAFRPLIDGRAVFDDFTVRVIEARINETYASTFRRFVATGYVVEEIAPILG